MRKYAWQIVLGVTLIGASVCLFLVQETIFHRWDEASFLLAEDLALLPIEVLLVTLILHQLLTYRERRQRLVKLNMVIGVFFSEVGTQLLRWLADTDPHLDDIRARLIPTTKWTPRDFLSARRSIHTREHKVHPSTQDLARLREFLHQKRDFLLRLLENPNLLEHESFTDLLWAAFHLTDELLHRTDISSLPPKDLEHLAGDVSRTYHRLLREWLAYMQHLAAAYPYLYSLALRTNPFAPQASPVLT